MARSARDSAATRALVAHLDQKATGKLTVGAGAAQISVYVMGGNLLAAESPDDNRLLVHLLQRQGVLRRKIASQLEAAIEQSEPIFGDLLKYAGGALDGPLYHRFENNLATFSGSISKPKFEELRGVFVDNIQMGHDARETLERASSLWDRASTLDVDTLICTGSTPFDDNEQLWVAKAVGKGDRTISSILLDLPMEELHARILIMEMLERGMVQVAGQEPEPADEPTDQVPDGLVDDPSGASYSEQDTVYGIDVAEAAAAVAVAAEAKALAKGQSEGEAELEELELDVDEVLVDAGGEGGQDAFVVEDGTDESALEEVEPEAVEPEAVEPDEAELEEAELEEVEPEEIEPEEIEPEEAEVEPEELEPEAEAEVIVEEELLPAPKKSPKRRKHVSLAPSNLNEWMEQASVVDEEELDFFADHDFDRGSDEAGAFSSKSHNLDRIEVAGMDHKAASPEPEVIEADEAPAAKFSAPVLGEDEALEKMGVANDVLAHVVSAFDAAEGAGRGRAVVQLLVDGSPSKFAPLFADLQITEEGSLPDEDVMGNLYARPASEHRQLINQALVDLIERALSSAADELPDDKFDDMYEAVAGYRQRLGL